jgi:hypothetical protein
VKADPNMEENTNLATCVLEEFSQFFSVFSNLIAKTFLLHKSFNHIIDMMDDEQLLCGLIYTLLETELEALMDYLYEIL